MSAHTYDLQCCIAFSASFRLFFLSCSHREGIAIIHAPSTSTTKSFLSTSKSVSRPVSFVSASVPLPCCGRRLYTTAKRRINSQLEGTIHLHRLQPVKDTEINSIYSISRDFGGPTVLTLPVRSTNGRLCTFEKGIQGSKNYIACTIYIMGKIKYHYKIR